MNTRMLRSWTAVEDSLLQKWHNLHIPDSKVAYWMGRTREAVKARRRILRLVGDCYVIVPIVKKERERPKPNTLKYVNGYIHIYKPEHSRAKDGYVPRHILVMEEKIGRPLKQGEVVHHKNHIRTDNNPNNLKLCYDKGSHYLIHLRENVVLHKSR